MECSKTRIQELSNEHQTEKESLMKYAEGYKQDSATELQGLTDKVSEMATNEKSLQDKVQELENSVRDLQQELSDARGSVDKLNVTNEEVSCGSP